LVERFVIEEDAEVVDPDFAVASEQAADEDLCRSPFIVWELNAIFFPVGGALHSLIGHVVEAGDGSVFVLESHPETCEAVGDVLCFQVTDEFDGASVFYGREGCGEGAEGSFCRDLLDLQ
jgi:hypothetical protein